LTVAYLANQFPSPVEPYVAEEIEELHNRGIRVIAGSVHAVKSDSWRGPRIVLRPITPILLFQALGLCFWRWRRISPVIARVLFCGSEGPIRRMKALAHTLLGACYAVKLKKQRCVDHIHAHHGFCGSWIAMVAARILGAGFSMTLHGSDLLLRRDYLDVKLANSRFCLTVSEYNRQYILENYPVVDPAKIVVSRLGVNVPERRYDFFSRTQRNAETPTLLAVGRLHKVKDHAFLIKACVQLKERGIRFECLIAGDGSERRKLQALIRRFGLDDHVALLGHISRDQMDSLYDRAHIVVLTSKSEGIPLVLMEAMARGKVVLAPAITGIPELVQNRKTGFLYEAASLEDFLRRLLFVCSALRSPSPANQLNWLRHAATVQVRHNFNRKTNLKSFGDLFIAHTAMRTESLHENPVLQQVQLPLQRNRGIPVRVDGTDALAGT
jgi:glycosyltransferase involved in cell wall biosynthesis